MSHHTPPQIARHRSTINRTNQHFISRLFFLTLLTLNFLSIAQGETPVSDEGITQIQDKPAVRVIAVEGEVVIAGDDGPTAAKVGDRLPLGATLQTGKGSRIVLSVEDLSAKPAPKPILLNLAEESEINRLVPQECNPSGPPLVVSLKEGICRIDSHHVAEGAPVILRCGSWAVDLRGSDTITKRIATDDHTDFLVAHGTIVVQQGERKIYIHEGKTRSCVGDKPKGARQFAQADWDKLVESMQITGFDRPDLSPQQAQKDQYVYVRFETSLGDIDVALNEGKAPKTVANFLSYVDRDFYSGTIFHRVIKENIVQGGGFTANLTPKEVGSGVVNEWKNGLKNQRGTIAMARFGGLPDSATSQFYFNVMDNPALDQRQRDGAGYAVFGHVVLGMEVLDTIRSVPTHRVDRHADMPQEPVHLNRVIRIDPPTSSEDKQD